MSLEVGAISPSDASQEHFSPISLFSVSAYLAQQKMAVKHRIVLQAQHSYYNHDSKLHQHFFI